MDSGDARLNLKKSDLRWIIPIAVLVIMVILGCLIGTYSR
jgi:hypothetical protein